MDLLLPITFILVALSGAAGGLSLATDRKEYLRGFHLLAFAAIGLQLAWLVGAGRSFQYCVMHDPWGAMAMLIIMGIGGPLWIGRKYKSQRIPVGALALLAVAIWAAYLVYPAPMSQAPTRTGVFRILHVFLLIFGFSVLVVGWVAGVLFIVRSFALKSPRKSLYSNIPWPSLTALDRLFFRSTGIGLCLMLAGIVLGLAVSRTADIEGSLFSDPKVLLTTFGCVFYVVVWFLRRWQGFCSRAVIGLGTLGFALVLLGFFTPDIVSWGFHPY